MGSSAIGLDMTPKHLCCQHELHAIRTSYAPARPTCRKRSHNSEQSKAGADFEQSALRPACLRSAVSPLAFLPSLLCKSGRSDLGVRRMSHAGDQLPEKLLLLSICLPNPSSKDVKPCMDLQGVGSTGTSLGDLSWLWAALHQSV